MGRHDGKSIGRENFRTLALPRSLIERVQKIVGKENGHDYSTVPEFVKEAIRIRLEEVEMREIELKRLKEELKKT